MIYNKFIVCSTNDTFEAKLAAGDIVDQHIVFIEETGKIWTNGYMYGGADINELPNASETIKGLISVGANITIVDGVISLTSENVENALGYIPVSASATNTTVPEIGETTTDMAVKALQDWDGDDIRDTKFKVNALMEIIEGGGGTGNSDANIQAVHINENYEDPVSYLTTGPQILTDEEKSQVKDNLGIVIENVDLTSYATKSEIPTKVSQLTNDSSFATKSEIPTKVSQLTNDVPYAEKLAIVNHGTGDTTFSLTPNILHKWGTVTSLTLTLATPSDTGTANYYMAEFVSGTTATSLNLPDTISWITEPNIEAGKTYQLSILNNLGVIGGA